MLISRIFVCGKNIQKVLPINVYKGGLGQQRKMGHHAVNYRVGPMTHSTATTVGAKLAGAAMWWWILWHLWHEHEHITGEFEYPDPTGWTNQELGIPDDH